MKKIEKEKIVKGNQKVYKIIKALLIITMLVLIFLIAPKLTELTKNIAKSIYELNSEYITRFWAITLVLTTTSVFFLNKKEK